MRLIIPTHRLGPQHRLLQHTASRRVASIKLTYRRRQRQNTVSVMAVPSQQGQHQDHSTALRCCQHAPTVLMAPTAHGDDTRAKGAHRPSGHSCSDVGLPRAAVLGVLGGGQLGKMLAMEAVRPIHSRTVTCACMCWWSPRAAHAWRGVQGLHEWGTTGCCWCRRAWASGWRCWTPRPTARQPALPGRRWAASGTLQPSGAVPAARAPRQWWMIVLLDVVYLGFQRRQEHSSFCMYTVR